MKFKCVRIEPNIDKTDWTISIQKDDQDREDKDTVPNSNGFFWCREDKEDSEAICELLDCVISAHQKAMNELSRSMDKLQQCKFKHSLLFKGK